MLAMLQEVGMPFQGELFPEVMPFLEIHNPPNSPLPIGIEYSSGVFYYKNKQILGKL